MTVRHLIYTLAALIGTPLLAFSPCPDTRAHEKYEDNAAPPRQSYQPPEYSAPQQPTKVKCHEEEPECLPMEVLCDAGPLVCNGADVFFTGSFILWWPSQEGTEYAMSGIGTNPSKGDTHDVDYGVQPGFKVGLGFFPNHDGWDLYAQYTWLHASADDRTTSSNLNPIVATTTSTISEANADWSLKFNTLDIELARNFFVSRYLKMRPFFGIKGTWQDQDYIVNYMSENPLFGRRNIRIDQDYWGVGIRGGCNTAWHFTNMFSFIGNVAISGLWSGYDVDRSDIDKFTSLDNTLVHTQNNFHTVLPVLELLFGLRFETWFYHEEYHLAIDAGWEEQVWWGHNRYVNPTRPQQNGGDLVFQGLTLTVRFDF